jgi:hypothetical protein
MPLSPSPQRQSVVSFPTPNVNDILFFESVDAERVGTDIPEYGTKHPDYKKWPDHRLVHVESSDDQRQGRYYRYYYAADQLNQDNENWSFSKADIGGTKFDAVTRNYVVRRSEFNPETLAMGAEMPDVPVGKFPHELIEPYVLAEHKQVPLNDKVLNGLYVIEQRVYVKKVPLIRLDFDEYFQTTNKTSQTLYYKTEVPNGLGVTTIEQAAKLGSVYWGMHSGTVRTVQQLSDNWYVVTEQEVVKSGSLSYITVINYEFPPVLDTVYFDEWTMKSGGERTYPRIAYTKGAYKGPCKALIQIQWSANLPTPADTSSKPQPKPFMLQTPLFSFSLPPTLHTAQNFGVYVGTEDETWEQTDGNFPMDATNVTQWQTHVASSEVKPFRGGWILETITVYPPV